MLLFSMIFTMLSALLKFSASLREIFVIRSAGDILVVGALPGSSSAVVASIPETLFVSSSGLRASILEAQAGCSLCGRNWFPQ